MDSRPVWLYSLRTCWTLWIILMSRKISFIVIPLRLEKDLTRSSPLVSFISRTISISPVIDGNELVSGPAEKDGKKSGNVCHALTARWEVRRRRSLCYRWYFSFGLWIPWLRPFRLIDLSMPVFSVPCVDSQMPAAARSMGATLCSAGINRAIISIITVHWGMNTAIWSTWVDCAAVSVIAVH